MAAPTIVRGSDYFFNAKWTGNGGGLRVGKFVPYTDNGTIAKSCIFNHGDTTNELQLAAPGSAGNQKTFTISFWFKLGKLGDQQYIYSIWDGTDHGSPYTEDRHYARLKTNNTLEISYWDKYVITNRTFEDVSKWYHFLLATDSTQSTASDRIKLYIDGDLITSFSGTSYFAQDTNLAFAKRAFTIANTKAGDNAQEPFDGYLAEFNVVEGSALTPSTFGITDTSTGRWIPKSLSSITYGTNGFRLQFANTAGQTIGHDSSGSGNTFTVDGMVAADITTDSPTQNFAVLDPLRSRSGFTFTEGNRKLATGNNTGLAFSTQKVIGTKFYFEAKLTGFSGGGGPSFGIAQEDTVNTTDPGSPGDGEGHKLMGYYSNGTDSAILYRGAYYNDSGNGASVNDWVQLAFDGTDIGNQKVYIGRNNTFYYEDQSKGSFNAAKPTFTFDGNSVPDARLYLSNRSGSSPAGSSTWENINFGSYSYNYTAPTGFGSLNQDNLAETTKGIPDFVWIKDRSNSYNHELYDTTRGPLNRVTCETDVEAQIDEGLQKFLKGGFQIEDRPGLNTSASNYISWNWLANGGTTSANTDGSGATIASTIQANQTAGFSIITYTGNGTSGAKVAHGLTQAPDWIISGCRSQGQSKAVYHSGVTNAEQYYGRLDLSDGFADHTGPWNDTAPTNKVITLGNGGWVNDNSENYVLWCWHAVEGYSAFGSYIANDNADGPFIYTGFKPKFLYIKANGAISHYLIDTERDPINPVTAGVTSDNIQAEFTNQFVFDFLSNGFKIRNSNSGSGASNNHSSYDPYYWSAFAEHPFVGDGTNPCTAR